ncbi:adenosine receptor A1-like isoform X1 [Mercenaria mercenaria]|uniref:adenosine receptor A1-like isoform X1 n=1 Tax=Mercenaria mercenaria TaxID=6596 RepID=UPI00234FAB90|nr:adenosine receptor A1-like isoform X1 [Mercenaria mercenaria]XP_053382696.1 adenosine receptor A1-like isoform X1 [Mercenaria mercenaria]XP_053382698.1 adenosine receptor A1-like isoform X1 [Mercenaria mercenaria]XP_053382699.1 adenosine receptor A1-like isoform X1 [Mercenaria mercenaria]
MASVTAGSTTWKTGHDAYSFSEINQTNESLVDLLPASLVLIYNICVKYLAFMIWTVAVPANILIVSILTKEKHRTPSTCVYFLSLAFADLCVNFRTFNFWLVRSNLVTYTSDFECQIEKGYPLLGMLASSWTLATISVERMLSVCIPYRMKNVCTVNVARASVVTIWMVSISIALLNGWFHHMGEVNCEIKNEYRDFFIDHIVHLDYCLDVVIPFFVILFNSVITIVRLRSRKTSSKTVPKAFGKSISILVLVISAIFFITQVPYGIVFVVQQVNLRSTSNLRMCYLLYLERILLVLKYVNYALNFYIYFLTASQFRQETKEVFISCKERFFAFCVRLTKCCNR